MERDGRVSNETGLLLGKIFAHVTLEYDECICILIFAWFLTHLFLIQATEFYSLSSFVIVCVSYLTQLYIIVSAVQSKSPHFVSETKEYQ